MLARIEHEGRAKLPSGFQTFTNPFHHVVLYLNEGSAVEKGLGANRNQIGTEPIWRAELPRQEKAAF